MKKLNATLSLLSITAFGSPEQYSCNFPLCAALGITSARSPRRDQKQSGRTEDDNADVYRAQNAQFVSFLEETILALQKKEEYEVNDVSAIGAAEFDRTFRKVTERLRSC